MSKIIEKESMNGGSYEQVHYHKWGKDFTGLHTCQFLPICTT